MRVLGVQYRSKKFPMAPVKGQQRGHTEALRTCSLWKQVEDGRAGVGLGP